MKSSDGKVRIVLHATQGRGILQWFYSSSPEQSLFRMAYIESLDEFVSGLLINELVKLFAILHQSVVKVKAIHVYVLQREFVVAEHSISVRTVPLQLS